MEISKKLIKHKLDFLPAWEYTREELDKTNILSSELINSVEIKKGSFFTLLSENANVAQIYNFSWGGILPQNPIEMQMFNGHESFYSWIPSINNELVELMLSEIRIKQNFSYVIDKIVGEKKDDYFIHYIDSQPHFFNEEVYFHVDYKNASVDVLKKCLKSSRSFWHSLCVFTSADFTNMKVDFCLEDMKQICSKTELFIVGAYDGEGYIFWEKEGFNFFD